MWQNVVVRLNVAIFSLYTSLCGVPQGSVLYLSSSILLLLPLLVLSFYLSTWITTSTLMTLNLVFSTIAYKTLLLIPLTLHAILALSLTNISLSLTKSLLCLNLLCVSGLLSASREAERRSVCTVQTRGFAWRQRAGCVEKLRSWIHRKKLNRRKVSLWLATATFLHNSAFPG